MGKLHLIGKRDAVAAADAQAGRGPLAHAVEGQDRGLVERRGEERAGGVRLVVLGEDERRRYGRPSAPADHPRPTCSFSEPQRHGLAETSETRRGESEVGLQQPLELQQRLVVEADVIEVSGDRGPPPAGSTPRRGAGTGVVFGARETLLLRRGHNAAVDNQRGG